MALALRQLNPVHKKRPLSFFSHLNYHQPIFLKSLFNSISEVSIFLTAEKTEVSSGNNLGFDANFTNKLLI